MDDIAASSTFKVDYAASGRSKCNRCRQAIDEKELRIGPMVQSDKGDFKYPQWHHFHCFEDGWLKKNPGAMTDVNAVSGIDQLQFVDQKKLKSLVVGGDSTLETKAVTGEEKKLAQENKLMWSRREKLEALSNAELASVLEHNQQPNSGKIFGGRMKMLERVSDAMTFGSLPKCSVCHNGDFYFSHGEYKCTGSLDEFAKCENRVTDIARGSFSVPNDVASAHKFLETFRFKARERTTAVMAAQNQVFANEEFCGEEPSGEETHSAVARRKRERDEPSVDALKPFQGVVVMFAGKLSKTQGELEKDIIAGGGSIAKTATAATVCVCTPQEAAGNGSKKGQDAVVGGVLCVSEAWIKASLDATHRLSAAESSPFVLANPVKSDASRDVLKALGDKYEVERAAQEQRALLEETFKEAPAGKKSQGEVIKKIVVKNGAAVEPESGMVECGHIFEPQPGDLHTSVMNMTDVTTGKNSFYILQLIEHDNKSKWTVFRKWGRLGDDSIGGTKVTDYPMSSAAKREFEKTFKDKTGNEWKDRKSFKKVYGKFLPLEIDFSDDSVKAPDGSSLPTQGYTGALPAATQDFVRLVFDIKAMNDALKEMEIDTQKMPLGKLSRNTINEGFKALNELQNILTEPAIVTDEEAGKQAALKGRIVSLTNRFYNFIPHVAPPTGLKLLETLEQVRVKSELLSALQDLEVASKMVSSSSCEGEHPIDAHYKKLKANLTLVDRTSADFKRVNDYIQNTHGHTHTTYSLELVDLWEVEREGEAERFKPFEHNSNRMMLWHGSRLTNWGGILSQGLRIAPPEAPSTGYMFGKGVYFADMSSKSANYCFTTSEKTTAVLMLCEVALGDMKEYKKAFYVDGLPKPYLSTKGVGQYMPDPKASFVEPNGCVIPLGKGTASNVKDTTLLYNEFIVYDVKQIRTRYVMRLNFKYHKKAGTFF
jgi:poly [ADP-ribose] polymerase 1